MQILLKVVERSLGKSSGGRCANQIPSMIRQQIDLVGFLSFESIGQELSFEKQSTVESIFVLKHEFWRRS